MTLDITSVSEVSQLDDTASHIKAINNSSVVKRIHREVRFGSYILGSTLGEGEFGKVKLGWRKDGKQPSQVAIKLIKRDTIMKDSESEIKIHREINSLKMLNHPNIVNLVEVMKSGKYIGIVLEYASGGELFDYILQHKYLKENVAKKLFAQLVSGVDYMHSKGLIHRDLKLENLLLDKHKNVIISDFGFVNSYNKDKNDLMKTSCGSPCYAAPELVLTQSPYEGRKVDTWSLGVILYAMLAGYLPFDDDPENEDGSDIVRLYHYICKTPLTFPEYISPLARDLLRKIIVPDPNKRINIKSIKNHAWLTPYASLLSVSQPEWDKVHKDKKNAAIKTSAAASNSYNKRFSMINEKTNSSSLMMPAPGRSYSSSNVVGQLYSNPSAPTTSSSMANAVALQMKDAPVETSNTSPTKQLPNGNAYSTSNNQRGHAKSTSISNPYSSASTALKAMVTDNDNKRNSMVSLESTNSSSMVPPSITKPNYQQFPTPNLPRSTTYTGSSISTIVESPSKPRSSSPLHLDKEPTVPASSTASTSNILSMKPGTSSSRESARLPHTKKKPRPTSYHPSSMSASLMPNNSSGDYMKIPTPLLPIPQLLSTSPIKGSPASESSSPDLNETNNSSPTSGIKSTASINSRRNSVVTHVHVNGVLTSESNLNNHENKRNSVLSYLEDKMDALELTELHSPLRTRKSTFNDNTSDTNITPQLNQRPVFDDPVESPVFEFRDENHPILPSPVSEIPSTKGAVVNDAERNIEAEIPTIDRVNAVQQEEPPQTETWESTREVSCSQEDVMEPPKAQPVVGEIPIQDVAQLKEMSNLNSIEEKENIDRRLSIRREGTRDSKTHNKDNKDNKKRNRFSLLSFYSNYNSSSSNVILQPAPISSNSHSSTKRILEPSSEINTPPPMSKEQKRVQSNSSSKSSNSKRSGHSSGTGISTNHGKEASAARKVMDFFKRRSVRIG